MTAKPSKQTELLVSMLIKPNRIKTLRHFQQVFILKLRLSLLGSDGKTYTSVRASRLNKLKR